MICIMSVQHTGTWFAIWLLEKLLQTRCIVNDQLYGSSLVVPKLVHFHVGTPVNGLSCDNVVHRSQPEFVLKSISCDQDNRVIVPVRDPVRSLITRQNRHKELNHNHIVQGFDFVASGQLSNVFFLPIDIHDVQYRNQLLYQLCHFIGLEVDDRVQEIIDQYADQWVPVNSTVDCGYHNAYGRGDWDYLDIDLHMEMQLLYSKPHIRDWLMGLGYTSLPWYKFVKDYKVD